MKGEICSHLGICCADRSSCHRARASACPINLADMQWVPIDPPLYAETGNILLSRLMGGDVRLNAEVFDIGHKAATEAAFKEVEESGGKP
jgi:1-aminocyclopropane-1-carboxylate deaminase